MNKPDNVSDEAWVKAQSTKYATFAFIVMCLCLTTMFAVYILVAFGG